MERDTLLKIIQEAQGRLVQLDRDEAIAHAAWGESEGQVLRGVTAYDVHRNLVLAGRYYRARMLRDAAHKSLQEAMALYAHEYGQEVR